MTVLVGDIGGTHSRFGLAQGAEPAPTGVGVEAGDDHATFEDAVAAYLDKAGAKPTRAAFAIAGPVSNGRGRLTNRAGWDFDPDALARRFGFERVAIINDFVAQAASLPHLDAQAMTPVGGAAPTQATKVALGPGTGLGVAGLARVGDRWIPLPSEGGHVELAAVDAREAAALALIRAERGRVEAETVLSGTGMPRLHKALTAVDGRAEEALSAPEITERALAGDDAARETIRVFLAMLARFAGDMALVFGAEGGVYLCGGVTPKLSGLLDQAAFRAAFEAKAPHEAMMRRTATLIVSSDESGLIGCAAIALGR